MPTPAHRRPLLIAAAATVVALASTAPATQTQFLRVDSKEAFTAGTLDGLVLTNFGELRLARRLDTLLKDDGKYASVDAIAETADGTVYVGTSASGKLYSMKDDRSTEIADFGEAAGVTALHATPGGDVIVGLSGERGRLMILRRGSEQAEELVTLDDDVQYVWAIGPARGEALFVATGPSGKLYHVDPATKAARVLFDSEEDNLRSLAVQNDTIFVGTDPHGLVLRIDATTGKAFVVYDAPETEISALLIDPRSGQLYAATSQLIDAAEALVTPAAMQPAPSPAPPAQAGGSPSGGNGADELPDGTPPGTPPAARPADPTPPAADGRPGELRADTVPPEPPRPDADAAGDAPASRPANAAMANVSSPSGPRPMTPAAAGGEVAANGNAVYRIDAQGFVSEVFRETDAMIFALARKDDELLIATGPSGTLYQLNLRTEEHVEVAQSRARMLTALLLASDGRAWIGSSASAELARVGADLAQTGTFTSAVLDATQVSQFGKLQARGTVPDGATMTLSARSSNVSDGDSPLWSDWTEPVPAARFAEVRLPPARYAQVRVTMTGDAKRATPTLGELALAYVRPNVAPRIDAVTIATPAAGGDASDEPTPQPTRQVQWTAADANGDAMRFAVSVRPAGSDEPWVQIAKDLEEVTYAWDTRRVRDGRYEVRIEASDALANAAGAGKSASRVSDAVTVDNAPPTIGDITQKRDAGRLEVGVRVVDKGGGIVAGLEYRLDDARDWQTATPSDNLDDSPDERYAIVLPDPGNATRVLSLRGRDEFGNAAYESVTIRPAK